MGDGSAGAVWFGAPGFKVLRVLDSEFELVVEVESTATVVGCGSCGTRAKAKDRRWVTLADAPSAGRPVRVRWRKRVWSCPESACDAKTWTEQSTLAGPRRVLTERAASWATERLAAVERTTASLARGFRGVVVDAAGGGRTARPRTDRRSGPGRADRDGRVR